VGTLNGICAKKSIEYRPVFWAFNVFKLLKKLTALPRSISFTIHEMATTWSE